MLRRSNALFLTGVVLAALVVVSLGATAGATPNPGKGRPKVTLCHKGRVTISVGAPAVKAHLRHGDTLGTCSGQAPAPGTATLTVIKQVINDHGGTKTAADFTITIVGVTALGGNSFAGSAVGTTKTLTSVGSYTVTEAAVTGYALQSASAGCSGTIALGESRTCVLTNNDV